MALAKSQLNLKNRAGWLTAKRYSGICEKWGLQEYAQVQIYQSAITLSGFILTCCEMWLCNTQIRHGE